jgi:hypothetical protein
MEPASHNSFAHSTVRGSVPARTTSKPGRCSRIHFAKAKPSREPGISGGCPSYGAAGPGHRGRPQLQLDFLPVTRARVSTAIGVSINPRQEFETSRMVRRLELERGGTLTSEEFDRQLETIIARLEDIPASFANGIAEAARRADGINQANAAVGVRLRSAITEAVGILVAITADKTGKAA